MLKQQSLSENILIVGKDMKNMAKAFKELNEHSQVMLSSVKGMGEGFKEMTDGFNKLHTKNN